MKAVALALIAAAPCAAADFGERWNAISPPPAVEIAAPTIKPHARVHHHRRHHFTCHRVWYTRNHWRYWRCRR